MSELTREEVARRIGAVEHPAIARTLTDLGIVRSFDVSGNTVHITLAFPFPHIPIAGMLMNLLRTPLEELGAEVDFETTVMTDEERQAFFKMEQEGWKGGI